MQLKPVELKGACRPPSDAAYGHRSPNSQQRPGPGRPRALTLGPILGRRTRSCPPRGLPAEAELSSPRQWVFSAQAVCRGGWSVDQI